jgi:hypothetical protein
MARTQPDLTAARANRLCKMLMALNGGPQAKDDLVRKLRLEERGFFRDLKLIRQLGIAVASADNRYLLTISLNEALSKLPVPDLKLSLRDALELSHGQSPTHRRVRRKIEALIGPVDALDEERVSHRAMIGVGP